LVLAFVTTTSHREVQWITEDIGRVFPQQWQRFIDAIPERLRHLRPVEAYARMLADPDPIARDLAAQEWCAWEDAHVSLTPGHAPNPRYQDPEFRLRFARLVTHYWQRAAFLEENRLIRDAPKLNGIPRVLIHGRFDVSGPLITAWRLSQQMDNLSAADPRRRWRWWRRHFRAGRDRRLEHPEHPTVGMMVDQPPLLHEGVSTMSPNEAERLLAMAGSL